MIPPTECLGVHVPTGWRVRPFWSLFRRIKRTGFPDEQLLSVYRDHGVVPKCTREDNFNKASEDLSVYQLVVSGSLVTNKMKAWQGSIAISRHRGIVSPAYYVYHPLSAEDDQFLHYLLRSRPYIALYQRISKGIRVNQWDLEHEALRSIPVLLPNLATQKRIAAFLDRETARIDALIEKKERLVQVLLEKRSATITHAVARGLHSEAEMRESIINNGEPIPRHWEERRLSMLCDFFQGKAHEPFFDSNGPYICITARFVSTSGNQRKYCTRKLSSGKAGDIAMVMSDLPNGRALARAYLIDDDDRYAVNQRVCAITPREGDSRFFAYQLDRNNQLLSYNDGFNQTHLSNRAFLHLILRIPPVWEQVEIADYLDVAIGRVDQIARRTHASIDRLREYRAALITAAVTGRIDVDDYARRSGTDRRLDEIEEEMQA